MKDGSIWPPALTKLEFVWQAEKSESTFLVLELRRRGQVERSLSGRVSIGVVADKDAACDAVATCDAVVDVRDEAVPHVSGTVYSCTDCHSGVDASSGRVGCVLLGLLVAIVADRPSRGRWDGGLARLVAALAEGRELVPPLRAEFLVAQAELVQVANLRLSAPGRERLVRTEPGSDRLGNLGRENVQDRAQIRSGVSLQQKQPGRRWW